ncbi:TetR/AcrR family transcriptional regulator [Caulobacter sp. UNC279MFTsu5.1]|uniref:TetR/AcrR family transcriptional regulator n=1 Tax=Caulobacter sp. UNC279MFTsu5.1 TaxID=1502775 RepID=UPI00035E1F7E|nr:TetR/AcrR family transcriptional regulator [Caulobacter sp. UNC279MFTsu5.1]SFI90443.1 transcriptional regulator, TetR family [Caulobacter sp. UNC279MFTsu5.1]
MTETPAKRRGRPRAYDPDLALAKATEIFWAQGFAGASLDDLSAATGMNRPSLYGAFGDKQTLFKSALDRYMDRSRAAMIEAFRGGGSLREVLTRIYHTALSFYLSEDFGGRGCFLASAGLGQALVDDEVRQTVADGMHELDRGIEGLLQRRQARGELPPTVDPIALGRVASMMMNALSVRARAGETREQLEATIPVMVGLICGSPVPEPQASE